MAKSNKTWRVELENVKTKQPAFLYIEDCKDMDDCINHVRKEHPLSEWDINEIGPIK